MSSKNRSKKSGPIRVRHIATDTYHEVPREEYISGRAEQWIEQQLQAKAMEDADRERRAAEAVIEAERKQIEELTLQQQLDAANARLAAIEAENEKLRMATPEASAATMGLMHATQMATNLRLQLQQDTGEISNWWSKNLSAVDDAAAELRRKNAVLDDETAERKLQSGRFMNQVAIAQGLPAPHPHLLEEGGNETGT